MSDNMESLILETDNEQTEATPCETPLDDHTEWTDVINRAREAERQREEESRQKAAEEREYALKRKAAFAEEEARRYAEQLAAEAEKKHRMKIIGCLCGIVLMLILSGGSFALQYEGYIKFPWPIVITAVFCSVAAFFSGIVWEACRK